MSSSSASMGSGRGAPELRILRDQLHPEFPGCHEKAGIVGGYAASQRGAQGLCVRCCPHVRAESPLGIGQGVCRRLQFQLPRTDISRQRIGQFDQCVRLRSPMVISSIELLRGFEKRRAFEEERDEHVRIDKLHSLLQPVVDRVFDLFAAQHAPALQAQRGRQGSSLPPPLQPLFE